MWILIIKLTTCCIYHTLTTIMWRALRLAWSPTPFSSNNIWARSPSLTPSLPFLSLFSLFPIGPFVLIPRVNNIISVSKAHRKHKANTWAWGFRLSYGSILLFSYIILQRIILLNFEFMVYRTNMNQVELPCGHCGKCCSTLLVSGCNSGCSTALISTIAP